MAAINQLNIQSAQLEEQLVAAQSNLERIEASIEQTILQSEAAGKELNALHAENEDILGKVAELEKEAKETQAKREATLQNISTSRNERAWLQEAVSSKEIELKELARQQKD